MKKIEFFKKRKITLAGGLLVFFSLFLLAFSESKDFKLVKNIEIYTSLFRELNLYYVDETDPEKLITTSIDEMLKTLDPYTVYIPESELEDLQLLTTGEYGGIGSLIRNSGDYAVISEVYENFPADRANLKAGDLIIAVDGVSTRGLGVSKISDLLKGLPGTQLEITIHRPGSDQPIVKTMTRKKIQIKSVPYYGMLDHGIGYIRLSNFTMGAGEEVKNALVGEYVDFNIPWNLSLRYNYNYTNTGRSKRVTQTFNFSGNVSLTAKWKIGFSSGYDFKSNKLTYTSVNIYRDLHCWEMRFSWIPIGFHQSYSFQINVKSAILKDLKYEKRKSWYDR